MLRDGLRCRLRADGGERVELVTFDRTISFPAQCAPALRSLLEARPVRVAQLPGLDDDADRLVLARRLLREAVVVPA